MGKLLEVAGLSFSYGKKEIFRDLSFSLERGTVTCLLGPNGCGKTTLIDAVMNFHKPSGGSAVLGGFPVGELPPPAIAKLAAYVPQHHEKHFPYKVSDIILMGRTALLGFLETPGEEDRLIVKEILEKTGFTHFADRDYRELSGGETQIVLILRALVQEAPLIVMDEPTSHLDFRNELVLMEKIRELVKEENRGILMSTHSPNQALLLSSWKVPVQVLLMGNGVILHGAPEEVLTPENMEAFYGIRAVKLNCGETGLSSLVPMEILRRQIR